jgi:hypothetical protein
VAVAGQRVFNSGEPPSVEQKKQSRVFNSGEPPSVEQKKQSRIHRRLDFQLLLRALRP